MRHVVLIDLDVLLDTRLATLAKLDVNEAYRLLQSGYGSRTTDDLTHVSKVITNEQYQEAYRNRDTSTLQAARLTNYIFELCENVRQLCESIVNDTGRITEAAIVINHYPYVELDKETLNHIVYAVSSYVTSTLDIKVICEPPDVLDMRYLKRNKILTYITYDFKIWFEAVFNERKGRESIVSYPKLTVVAPKIMPSRDAFDKLDGDARKLLRDKSPFEFMPTYWAPIFGLRYCPIELMSVIDTSII